MDKQAQINEDREYLRRYKEKLDNNEISIPLPKFEKKEDEVEEMFRKIVEKKSATTSCETATGEIVVLETTTTKTVAIDNRLFTATNNGDSSLYLSGVKEQKEEPAHAKYSISAREQLVNCPPSNFLSRELEGKTSSDAELGNKVHKIGEECIPRFFNGESYDDILNDILRQQRVPSKDAKNGVNYAKYCYDKIKPYLIYPHSWFAETRLYASDIDWGTIDFHFIYESPFTIQGVKVLYLIIIDYKNGYKEVKAIDNLQLIGYTRTALHTYNTPTEKIFKTDFVVYQPNSPEPIKEHSYLTSEIEEKWAPLMDAAITLSESYYEAGEVPEEDLKQFQRAGDWCQWCKVKGECKAYKAKNADKGLALFHEVWKKTGGDIEVITNPKSYEGPTGLLSPEEQSELFLGMKDFKGFIEAVAESTEMRMIQGQKYPGLKLIKDSVGAKRSWISDVTKIISTLKQKGISEPMVVADPKLISFGEVEKQLGKGAIDELLNKPEETYKVVPEDNAVPHAMLEKETRLEQFAEVLNLSTSAIVNVRV